MAYGGIEAGGTKWVCAVGSGPEDIRALVTFPTTTPEETLATAVRFFAEHGPIEALGVGSFGPIDLRQASPAFGTITTTPKPGWGGTDLLSPLRAAFGVPVAFDTDVNAAAIGELHWGAAAGLDTFCYVTVGTGIGGGVIVDGRPLHGLLHPELGHMLVPHDRVRDPFDGVCPYHGDCLEGLASGVSIRRRWGVAAEDATDPDVWRLEAEYLALGLANLVCSLSPQRIVIGGGVLKQPLLLPLVRARLVEVLAGYVDAIEVGAGIETYVVPPALGDRAGVLGAFALAGAAAS